jgi:hypothetical protein
MGSCIEIALNTKNTSFTYYVLAVSLSSLQQLSLIVRFRQKRIETVLQTGHFD